VEKSIYRPGMCPFRTTSSMSYSYDRIERIEQRAADVKEVLSKYGLEMDQQALYDLGLKSVDDIPYLNATDLLDPQLKGTPAQYKAMQEGEYAQDDEQVRLDQPGDFFGNASDESGDVLYDDEVRDIFDEYRQERGVGKKYKKGQLVGWMRPPLADDSADEGNDLDDWEEEEFKRLCLCGPGVGTPDCKCGCLLEMSDEAWKQKKSRIGY
jgi:hypothetical protein